MIVPSGILSRRDRLSDVLVGVLVVLLLSLSLLYGAPNRWLAILFALGFSTIGFLVGFVFGIPKIATQTTDVTTSQPNRRRLLLPNTNLDQISDWLTKTIVGLGLVELNKIPGSIQTLASYLATLLGTGALSNGYCTAIVIEFPVVGFVGGYLVTRLVISRLLGDVERALATSPDDQDQLRNATTLLLTPGDTATAPAQVPPATRKVALDVADRSLEDLSNVSDIRAWARAKMVLEDYDGAIRGFRLAAQLDPNDVRTRVELATALDKSTDNKYGVIREMLRNLEYAYAHLDENTPDSLRTAVYEYLTYANVFAYQPKGFSDAIKYGEEFAATNLGQQSDSTWVNLAAAYAQRFGWQQRHGGTADELKLSHDAALGAARRALELNPANRELLKHLLVKAYPGKRKDENDLEVFENDPDFRSLILGDGQHPE